MDNGNISEPLKIGVGSVVAGRYEITRRAGSGAAGTVFIANDQALNAETIALKLLHPQFVMDHEYFCRFRDEVLIARQLTHPNIVRIHDFGDDGQNNFFITMEYVEGTTLERKIGKEKNKILPFPETIAIFFDICEGMAHAHKMGIIHRDLKPGNILISNQGHVKVADFGLARTLKVDSHLTQSGCCVGTPCYIAPELIEGKKGDFKSDIYSLGIMAYELVTGEVPFNGENWYEIASKHMRSPLPGFGSHNVPRWFRDIVKRCTAKNPDDRFNSVDEICALRARCTSKLEKRKSKWFFTKSEAEDPCLDEVQQDLSVKRWHPAFVPLLVVGTLVVVMGFYQGLFDATKTALQHTFSGVFSRFNNSATEEKLWKCSKKGAIVFSHAPIENAGYKCEIAQLDDSNFVKAPWTLKDVLKDQGVIEHRNKKSESH